jgi:hypothetical protein
MSAPAQAEVVTFFAGTQYAVDVHFLRGEKPGPTIMIQGGIQGDEYCGYLTAQLLAQAKVLKGNLIVLPRANPPSIHERLRQINVDLNRRFGEKDDEYYEDSLARLIRFLVDQSQGLIHLHEGSGFYNPVKLDDLHGPKRYGQSIIIDTTTYKNLHLEQTARAVLSQLNDGLKPDKFQFKLFDMETFNDNSIYLEHRKSLTFYTLTRVGVPAFAVEVSKNLVGRYWSYWKVSHQLQAAVLLLKQLGVEVEVPSVKLEDFQAYPPQNLKVVVDGQALDPAKPLIRVKPEVPLEVRCENSGPELSLAPIPAVFASDRQGLNLLKARRLPMAPFQSLEVKSDGILLAKAQLSWADAWPASVESGNGDLVCWLNGELKTVPAGGTLTAVQGDQLILEGIRGSHRAEVLKLKGYMSRVITRSDRDTGREIVLDPKAIIAKFFVSKTQDEAVCEVVREVPGVMPHERFLIRIKPRQVKNLVLTDASGQTLNLAWSPNTPLTVKPGRYVLSDVQGNGPAGKVQVFLNNTPVNIGGAFTVGDKAEIVLRQATTFAEMGRMPVRAGQSLAAR